MINPPRSGTFSTPLNSIFQNRRLKNPTMGLSISSAHCGNIVRPACGRISTFFDGYVPLVLKVGNILQRPFLIYELDVNSGNAVSPCAAGSNGRVRGDSLLLARQANKTARRSLQRREERGAVAADVLGDGLFTLNNLTLHVKYLYSHVNGDLESRKGALIYRRQRRQHIVSGG